MGVSRRGVLGVLCASILSLTGTVDVFGAVLYASNSKNNTVDRINADGSITTFATGMSTPDGLAFDPQGNLYVANFGSGKVAKVTPAGVVSTFASGITGAYGLAYSNGNLYVSSFNSGAVSKVDSTGQVSAFAAPLASGSLGGVAVGSDGTVYTTAYGTSGNKLYAITSGGTVSTYATVNGGGGLTFDSAGNLYVAYDNGGTGGGAIHYVAPDQTIHDVVSTGLSRPEGLTFDASGQLYVAEGFTGQIDAVSASGTVTPYVLDQGARFLVAAPVPEPTSVAVALIGAVCFLVRGRRAPRA